jgi:two-component system response regulator YesN
VIQDGSRENNTEEAIERIMAFFEHKNMRAICNYIGEYQYSFILAYENGEKYRLSGVFQSFLSCFKHYVIGIGFDTNDIRNVYNSYQTAVMAINLSFYDNANRSFYVDDEILKQRLPDTGLYGEFLLCLKDQPHLLKEWCENLFMSLKENKYCRKEQVQSLLASLVTVLCRDNMDILDGNEHLNNEEQIELTIHSCYKLSEIQAIMMELIARLEKKLQDQSQYSRTIRGVTNYISNHYNEPELSISQIAEYFHFSSAYLSVLFKQEMNTTIKQYISNYRIERAKRLLESEYDKITEIAVKCGYANANYFAKVFKEATGMTPSEYRGCMES